MCSTPFGITEVVTPASLRKARYPLACSTPFGITEVVTPLTCGGTDKVSACSTPFGITEVVTVRPQRNLSYEGLCSTPFGITEVVTKNAETHPEQKSLVLNAFRHHRGSHRSEITIWFFSSFFSHWQGPVVRLLSYSLSLLSERANIFITFTFSHSRTVSQVVVTFFSRTSVT